MSIHTFDYVWKDDKSNEIVWIVTVDFTEGYPAKLTGDPDTWYEGLDDEYEVLSVKQPVQSILGISYTDIFLTDDVIKHILEVYLIYIKQQSLH